MNKYSEFEAAGLMFDAALGRTSWHDVGARFVQLFDAATLAFIVQDSEQDVIDPVDVQGITAKELEAYAAHFAPHDLWVVEARRRHLHTHAMIGTDLVSVNAWRNSVIYNELCRPNTDVFHGVMTFLRLSDGGLAALGIHRPSTGSAFRREDASKLDRMLPSLDRALQVRSRLQGARIDALSSGAVLDNLAHGLVQLTANGRLVHANPAAFKILWANDGLSLTYGRIHAALPSEDLHLRRCITNAAAWSSKADSGHQAGGHLRISRPSGNRPYNVVVTPIGLDRAALLPPQPAVLLFITDPEEGPDISVQSLREMFDLTPAEARIVAGLAAGQSLHFIAKSAGISFETARTHLARARAKTQTGSQTELVRAVLLALAPIARRQPNGGMSQ